MNKLNLFALSSLFILAAGCSSASRDLASNPQGSSGQPNNLQANLAWTSNLGEQQGFYIEESTDGTNYSQILTVPDGTNNATIVVPTSGNYYFRIRGYNQAGDSTYSQVVTATI